MTIFFFSTNVAIKVKLTQSIGSHYVLKHTIFSLYTNICFSSRRLKVNINLKNVVELYEERNLLAKIIIRKYKMKHDEYLHKLKKDYFKLIKVAVKIH